eukprot:jgi/Phyca11/132098/e_gw1.132.29.1
MKPSRSGFHLVVKASGAHNHALSSHTWYNYSQNRRITDPKLRDDVAVMHKAGAKPKGILEYLRSKAGKRTVLQDGHNMIQEARHNFNAGASDGERALKVLDEFCEGNAGNAAEFVVDAETGVIRVITFQSARMKRLFAAFPEVVLVDSTHGTNVNIYKLFSFVIHDVFGRVRIDVQNYTENEQKLRLFV